jgi:hypothetical protein
MAKPHATNPPKNSRPVSSILTDDVGAGIIGALWFPRFLSGRVPAASALLILLSGGDCARRGHR